MSATTSDRSAAKIDKLMERASAALNETRYAECERLCREAFEAAHGVADYDRMARIVLPLQEARRNRRLAAIDTGSLFVVEDPIDPEAPIEPGCYLFQPPLVGADGRDLRERAAEADVPVFVVVREPRTQLGRWPIVMIGPVTVRTRIAPPADEDAPDMEWFIGAAEALGDAAIAAIDPEAALTSRVDALADRLATVVEHEKLHQRLEETCREAAAKVAAGEIEPVARKPAPPRRRARTIKRPG